MENLWQELNQIIAGMKAAKNLNNLAKKISCTWKILDWKKEFLSALTYSMPCRVEAVVNAEGDVSNYGARLRISRLVNVDNFFHF